LAYSHPGFVPAGTQTLTASLHTWPGGGSWPPAHTPNNRFWANLWGGVNRRAICWACEGLALPRRLRSGRSRCLGPASDRPPPQDVGLHAGMDASKTSASRFCFEMRGRCTGRVAFVEFPETLPPFHQAHPPFILSAVENTQHCVLLRRTGHSLVSRSMRNPASKKVEFAPGFCNFQNQHAPLLRRTLTWWPW